MGVYEELVDQRDAAQERSVRVERLGDRAVLTFDEPDRLNVLSSVQPPESGSPGRSRRI